MSEEERIKLLSKCKDIDCICQDCLYLEFVKNNILNPIQEENQELKKQLKNYKKLGFKYLQDKNNNLEAQQKEFIEYLEDLIKQNETVVEVLKYGLPKNCSKLLIDFYKEILSKYKEITGDKE